MDVIYNGQASGDVASLLMSHNCDPNALRPYIGNDGRTYITTMENGKPVAVPVSNATATLRKDDWLVLDRAIVQAAKPRLRAVGDLRSSGLQFTIQNGMGKTALETETMSDITDADISMDGLREGRADRPEFGLTNLPLPIIHKDFHYSLRQIMASRNGGSPLDTSTAELASRRVAEAAEKLLLGTSGRTSYGGGNIYGYLNFPSRMTKSLTDPTDQGWSGKVFIQELLEMKQQSQDAYHYGPWTVYVSTDWDKYLDEDYSEAKGDNTLRERVKKIDGIQDVRTLDYLTAGTVLLVQMTSDVVREVVGMDITTVQWPSHGGLRLNFKVMAILVPQLRADHYDRTGIVHGSV